MTLSTSHVLLAAAEMAKSLHPQAAASQHLDIGSGHGELIALLREKGLVQHSNACDCTKGLTKLDDVEVAVANLNEADLPFGLVSTTFSDRCTFLKVSCI